MTAKNEVIHAETGQIAQVLEELKLLATEHLMDHPVLFTGPTGSGKEMLADYLVKRVTNNLPHNKINCMNLSESVIESELFGHMRGAFTGAIKERKGLIEESEGGILFLDEIGVLPKHLQAKFLRVLEDREVRKIGGSRSKKINVRFIAATKDTKTLIPDLKHRFPNKIHIPPLKRNPRRNPLFA